MSNIALYCQILSSVVQYHLSDVFSLPPGGYTPFYGTLSLKIDEIVDSSQILDEIVDSS